VQDGRDDELDDDGERHGEGDQRADPLPAAEGQHGQQEQCHQHKHWPGPLEVADIEEGWPSCSSTDSRTCWPARKVVPVGSVVSKLTTSSSASRDEARA
jgi:hypothetical protein